MSASSINSQLWEFIVIESDEAKERMHRTFRNKHQFNQPHIKAASHIILFAHNPSYTREDYAKVVAKGLQMDESCQKIESKRLVASHLPS
ncbi:hypothetical protein [Escherichia coli]|uniref:hypothetical protein n=1 Tax=Escherichia coli TaxID=562 RepID=UPI0039C97359